MSRNIYLKLIPVDEAVARAISALDREALMARETVPTHEALGRVTAKPIFARYSSPTFHSAAMDGYAVRARDTWQAREGHPVILKAGRDFVPVNTGHPLPEDMDAVIMIEHVVDRDGDLAVEKPAFPMQHVRRIGEDIVATELLLPQNHTITAYDIGALLTAGIWEVTVWERVRLTVIPTGDEVLDFTARPEPGPGQVVESNSQVLAALAGSWSCSVHRVPPVPDDLDALERAVREALEKSHIVIIGAGSSAGSKDYTRTVMERVGQILVHGLSVMPGKPTLIGEARGRLMVGAPGYPVSSVVCYEDVLAPVVSWLARQPRPEAVTLPVVLARKVASRLGMEERVRLSIGRVGERYVALPLARGAGLITSLTRAQGVTAVPTDTEGLEEGVTVPARLLVPRATLDKTLVVIGSHDNTLDILANALMGLPEPVALASAHVGSMGGLKAIASGMAMVAGAHLFDPETEDFNFPFLNRVAPGRDLILVNLAIRHQGLIVAPGNPLAISGVADLARPEVTFINRQRGAGTRILLDHTLAKAAIAPNAVKGYDKEEFTHMAVAVNVLTGAADCGLGIHAAARALGLDFIPLARERYDLVIPAEFMDDPRIAALLALLE
ncbi:MAG: molybdopterin biosynthesis protein, partial [Deltaproteobacteria bacterium]|nr:molybdopterin biosynthesis protein [Deltaproteobacteria bacterium]